MGRANAEGMLDYGGDSDAVLDWHLRCNHFPPLVDGVRLARMAIAACAEGRGDEPVHDEASQRLAPSAWDVIESWHLEPWLAFSEHESGIEV